MNRSHPLLVALSLLAIPFQGNAKEMHWSLIPPQKESSAKSIDAFIEKKLSQKGLRHSSEASKRTLIRRVYLDMLGLIPTPEEVNAFLADQRKDAYEKLIEKVLENPSYGERWARHWLDVVRYADSAGFARNCILARRLLEKGVRFVQLFNGSYAMGEGVGNWDGHKTIEAQYPGHAHILDQPAAALIRDLKARGLLDDVLVVWCTEFGRMPTFQKGASGRDQTPLVSPPGWLERASTPPSPTEPPTNSVGRLKRTSSACTTFTPPSSTCSDSTTSACPTTTMASNDA